jgi:hypothetical protein
MGGDQVYPTPSTEGYEDRLKGPYIAALPCPPHGVPRPTLYALPGNHDWYDGLTAFLRLFVRVKTDNIGGWRTEQSRSYFAVERSPSTSSSARTWTTRRCCTSRRRRRS